VGELSWICDVCRAPVWDGDGYLTISDADIRRWKDLNRQWDEELDRRFPGKDEWRVYSFADPMLPPLDAIPRWRTLHGRCDPEPQTNDYWIGMERIREVSQVLSWTAHLIESKEWLPETDWDDVLRRVERQLTGSAVPQVIA
jgi:hypothetical protein